MERTPMKEELNLRVSTRLRVATEDAAAFGVITSGFGPISTRSSPSYMSTYENHPALQISFSGEPGQACQTFIDHITEYAFENNKQGDDEWIADFAAMRLRGAALTWLAELDEETQESWRKLRRALARAYRPTSDTVVTSYRSPTLSSTSPTPAAAPPSVPATISTPGIGTASKLCKGVIRVVSDDPEFSGYVSTGVDTFGGLAQTTDVANAAAVEFSLSDHPHEIKLIGADGSLTGLMGLHWAMEPKIAPNTRACGRVTIVQLTNGRHSSGVKNLTGPATPFAWLALMDGTLLAVHRDKNSIQHVLEIYVFRGSTGMLCFGLVFENIRNHLSDRTMVCRARLVFEAT